MCVTLCCSYCSLEWSTSHCSCHRVSSCPGSRPLSRSWTSYLVHTSPGQQSGSFSPGGMNNSFRGPHWNKYIYKYCMHVCVCVSVFYINRFDKKYEYKEMIKAWSSLSSLLFLTFFAFCMTRQVCLTATNGFRSFAGGMVVACSLMNRKLPDAFCYRRKHWLNKKRQGFLNFRRKCLILMAK